MKKAFIPKAMAALLAGVMLLSLAGCGSGAGSASTNSTTAATTGGTTASSAQNSTQAASGTNANASGASGNGTAATAKGGPGGMTDYKTQDSVLQTMISETVDTFSAVFLYGTPRPA